jgi:hypothetical protein
MVDEQIYALQTLSHANKLTEVKHGGVSNPKLDRYVTQLRNALHNTFRQGEGTRDMIGAEGLTTEQFVEKVGWRLGRYIARDVDNGDDEEPVPAHTVETVTPDDDEKQQRTKAARKERMEAENAAAAEK